MYTVSKGQSKIVQKTRRVVIGQKLERRDSRDHSRRTAEGNGNGEEDYIMNQPKPVFNNNLSRKLASQKLEQKEMSPHHRDMVKYVGDSWESVSDEMKADNNQNTNGTVAYFEYSEQCRELQDFKPFDLETWWGKRLFNKITESL